MADRAKRFWHALKYLSGYNYSKHGMGLMAINYADAKLFVETLYGLNAEAIKNKLKSVDQEVASE